MSWVLFPFCSIPSTPNHPHPAPTSCHLLSIYESVFVLLVSSVCSLDSTYKWNHMIFVLLWLTSLSILFSRSNHTVAKGKMFYFFSFFKILLTYFREGKGERETSMCGCLLCTPYWGPGPQPRQVLWLGVEPANLWFEGWHSVHWATPARTNFLPF